ncbi:MAG TPA: TonB family protein [Chitinispirillaceae bacterium]|nr:TonB family protein [Chitinispirillaceae bacterium]
MNSLFKLLPVFLLFILTILFNIGMINIRFDDIRYLLGSIASEEDVANTFGIVAKYELVKRRMQYGEENIANFELEAKMQTIISSEIEKTETTQPFYREPLRLCINGIRLFLGKKIINPKEDDKIFGVLEIAYLWERNRKYTEALKIYDDILATANNIQHSLRAAIMVHQAFCYSMISNYDKAKVIYENVINLFPSTEAGILAWKLLDFIQSMEKERLSVAKSNVNDLEKAKQYYLLMDFKNAIKQYSKIVDKTNTSRMAEAHFFKGRSHEELGETEEAIIEYKLVQKMDNQMDWGRQANRRLLMLGEFYEKQKSIADEAKKQLEKYQDQQFLKNMEVYSSFIPEGSLKNELLTESHKSGSADDSILKMIDNIGKIDLEGKSNPEKNKPVTVNIQKIDNDTKMTSAEYRELERKQLLNQNPYRRPAYLKDIIDNNSQQLRYIYNKRLRSGIRISGHLLVEMSINPDGAVGSIRIVQSNIGDQTFENDIAEMIKTWRFNQIPDSLGSLTVNYPFEFSEEQ